MGIPDNPLEALSLAELRRRTSMKWRVYPEHVLPLWVAEMDVPLAAAVARALHDAIDLGDTGYPAGTAYAEALSRFASDRWGWDGLAVERTAIVSDVMIGVVEMLKIVTGDGDAVVVNTPVYPPFFGFVEHLGRRVVEAALDERHRIDLDGLAEAFRAAKLGGGRAAYLLCSPHNPTGTVHTAAELAGVAALADEHGVRVVADEIHAPLILGDATFVPYLSVDGGSRGLSLMSASKAWNLAGLKAALAVAGPDAAADLATLPEEISHGPSHLAVIAHTAALNGARGWLDEVLAGLSAQRDLLVRLLDEHLPDVGFHRPDGTYFAWLDCSGLGLEATAEPAAVRGDVRSVAGPAAAFLDAGVALSAGPAFGTGGSGHVRLNFAASGEVLGEAVRRMASTVAR